jgi:hypothetical protein
VAAGVQVKGTLFCLVVMAAVASGAAAEDQNIGPMIHGPGSQSCGRWLVDRSSGGAPATADEGWVLGFISGYNEFELGVKFRNWPDVADGSDAPGIFSWIDNYCTANPMGSLANATKEAINAMVPTALRRQRLIK